MNLSGAKDCGRSKYAKNTQNASFKTRQIKNMKWRPPIKDVSNWDFRQPRFAGLFGCILPVKKHLLTMNSDLLFSYLQLLIANKWYKKRNFVIWESISLDNNQVQDDSFIVSSTFRSKLGFRCPQILLIKENKSLCLLGFFRRTTILCPSQFVQGYHGDPSPHLRSHLQWDTPPLIMVTFFSFSSLFRVTN